MTRARRPALDEVLRALASRHGERRPFTMRDPWHLVVWETCAFGVGDDTRRALFAALEKLTALDPRRMLDAPSAKVVEALEIGGGMARYRYEKLRLNATRALEMKLDVLRRATKRDAPAAKKLLKRFHGVGDPGADRVLMFAGAARTLGADAAVVRVLVRLGFGEDTKDWSRAYRTSARAVEPELPEGRDALVRAHLLLQEHGREQCKNTRPVCGDCPLRESCAHFARARPSEGRGADPGRLLDEKVAAWERMWRARSL
jgi:endonuclease III